MNYEKVISRISSVCGISGLLTILNSKFNTIRKKIILEYHGVTKNPGFNCVSIDNFRKQVEYIAKNYEVVSLENLCNAISHHAAKSENVISLTFDDAYVNIYSFAYPLLKEMEIPFTVFVPAGFVGKTNIWDKDRSGFEEIRIMSYHQMVDMDPRFVSFGSHGLFHKSLRKLEEKELKKEVDDSKRMIEEGTGRSINLFCYPYGGKWDFDERSIRSIKKNGYICACSTIFGRFNSQRTVYALRRIEVEPEDSIEDFISKLNGDHDWKRIRHELKIILLGLKLIDYQ